MDKKFHNDAFQLAHTYVAIRRGKRKLMVMPPNAREKFHALGDFLNLLYQIYTKIDAKVLWEFTQGKA
jgi:uncharacterized protein YutE (UPF0331/DUF86 family)